MSDQPTSTARPLAVDLTLLTPDQEAYVRDIEERSRVRPEQMKIMIPGQQVDTLLPRSCPFCGAAATLAEIPAHTHVLATFMPDHAGSWTIECNGCSAGLIDETSEAVLAAWNRRAS